MSPVYWKRASSPDAPCRKRAGEGVLLDGFAQGADVIGGDEFVLPGQRGRMAGVVDERGEDFAGGVGEAADQEGVVGGAIGIVTADDAFAIRQVAVGGQVAAAGVKLERGGSGGGEHSAWRLRRGLSL